VHLTDISDTLSRDVKKLSNENRLSRNLKNFDFEKTKDIETNLYKKVLPDKETTIIIDGSDIANTQTHKRDLRACLCTQKQSFRIFIFHENLVFVVTDGSEEHKVVYGYYTNNLIALTKDKIPIFLYSKVYYPPANKAYTGFKTKENLNGIKDVEASLLDRQLLFLCDSGYDNYNYIKHFCDNNDFFIIRSSGLRDFYLNGNKYSFNQLFEYEDMYKWKTIPMSLKEGKLGMSQVAHINDVTITKLDNPMNIVLIKSSEHSRMILMTNKPIPSLNEAQHIYYKYMQRWKIETYTNEICVHLSF
jgi:hypothetical protein